MRLKATTVEMSAHLMRPSDTGRRPAPKSIRSASKLDLPRPVAVRRYVLALGWRPAFTKFTAADSERFRHLFTANGWGFAETSKRPICFKRLAYPGVASSYQPNPYSPGTGSPNLNTVRSLTGPRHSAVSRAQVKSDRQVLCSLLATTLA